MGSVSSRNRVIRIGNRGSQTSPLSVHEGTPAESSPIRNAFVPQSKQLTIIHFNDVYNIEAREKEPVGGASRFKTATDSLREKNPLVLFSGDAIAPSNISVVTQGRQMVPVLNSLNIRAAVYGNHEFDFGVEHLLEIKGETNFPWLMTNVKDKDTGRQLAEGKKFLIIEWEETKIGLLGLVEKEWLVTLATLTMEDVIYTDYVESAKELVPYLREQGCELVIALTHMRNHNDRRLAESVSGIDLILGGHDHCYLSTKVNGTPVLKSGTDFREFSEILVTVTDNNQPPVFDIRRHEVNRQVEENTEVKEIVEHYMDKVKEGLEEVIGWTNCSLEGRFKCVRTQETNLGDLICDIMRINTRADCVILNSGTLRSDDIHEAGCFRMKDLVAILPMVDPLTVLKITGEQLLMALENGVCQYPKHEGRFPQVSGLSFSFDPKQPSGHRVLRNTVKVNGEDLNLNEEYKLCTKAYLAEGRDGYEVFKSLPVILSIENGPILSAIVRNYFTNRSRSPEASRSDAVSINSTLATFSPTNDGINPKIEGRIIVCG